MKYYNVFSFKDGDVVRGYQSINECATDMGVSETKLQDIIRQKKMLNGLTFRLAKDISDFLLDIIYAKIEEGGKQ